MWHIVRGQQCMSGVPAHSACSVCPHHGQHMGAGERRGGGGVQVECSEAAMQVERKVSVCTFDIHVDGIGGHGDIEHVKDGAVCEVHKEVVLHDAGAGGGSPVGNNGGGTQCWTRMQGGTLRRAGRAAGGRCQC